MNGYQLRPSAEADLADIWRYTATRWNIEQANAYHAGIVEALTRIGENPEIGRECSDIREGYRRHPAGAHVIFYKIAAGVADVVRILHQNRDFPRHL